MVPAYAWAEISVLADVETQVTANIGYGDVVIGDSSMTYYANKGDSDPTIASIDIQTKITITGTSEDVMDGDVVVTQGNTISVESYNNHSITLEDCTIDVAASNQCAFSLKGDDDLGINLTVSGVNTLVSGGDNAGIWVPRGVSLTIGADSTDDVLNTTSMKYTDNRSGAGIGGSYPASGVNEAEDADFGQITIDGGTINATGMGAGAGIGGTQGGIGGSVVINGGVINATGTSYGAGIGGAQDGSYGGVSIFGGTINAVGGYCAAGIGGGYHGDGGTIVICNDAEVTAQGGTFAAGIGAGGSNTARGSVGDVKIMGGTVTAIGGLSGPGIGGTSSALVGKIAITGGTVTAQGGGCYGFTNWKGVKSYYGAGAGVGGGGSSVAGAVAPGCNIQMSDGTLHATAGANTGIVGDFLDAEAIGHGSCPTGEFTLDSGILSITGGTVYKNGQIFAGDLSSGELSGSDRYGTSVAVAEATYDDPAGVVLVSGADYADALAAAPLAGALGYPILLTSSSSLPDSVKAYIDDNPTMEDVIIVGGTGAVSDNVASELSSLSVKRIGGSDRYATADLVYTYGEELDIWSDTAIVASGVSYPDALSISPYAAAISAPILLTDANGVLSDNALDLISDFDNVVLVGGSTRVSESCASAIAELIGEDGVVRLAGTDRYETSAAIADYVVDSGILSYTTVVVATGQGYADALAGSLFCAQQEGVLLLVDDPASYANGDACLENLTKNKDAVFYLYYLGGTGALPSTLRALVEGALA